MDFTREEISLCKQIIEKHWKVIEHGDWFIDTKIGGKPFLSLGLQNPEENLFPLWTISDCLEFLREKGYRYNLEDYRINPKDLILIIISGGKNSVCRLTFVGKTPLEVCLKAVLSMLEEKKRRK